MQRRGKSVQSAHICASSFIDLYKDPYWTYTILTKQPTLKNWLNVSTAWLAVPSSLKEPQIQASVYLIYDIYTPTFLPWSSRLQGFQVVLHWHWPHQTHLASVICNLSVICCKMCLQAHAPLDLASSSRAMGKLQKVEQELGCLGRKQTGNIHRSLPMVLVWISLYSSVPQPPWLLTPAKLA